ncbi:alpha/beta fold hydrolase [Paenibacillus hexagrammi]|uniref:Alpha/beta hydrolase n=1 Tax=Paenibacillus hexagrammi TaxID=2908839 RepID=A0ABY3SNP9_9BACL|nr:alpha/beta hydrolase [Paenibacillus sp. YPD9-1]UJF35553.1 alpha/beta hydrolase [Paenibacillus sp. YPD9-1]
MTNKLQVGSAQVAYQTSGLGPGVLLIHGTGGNARATWSELTTKLSDHYKVVSADYSGSGETQDTGEDLTLDDLVMQNVEVALHEGLEEFHVVGYSLGAVVATAIAALYPDRVKSVTMVGGWVESDSAMALQFHLWRDLFRTDRRLFAELVAHTGFSPGFYQQYQSIGELKELCAVMADNFAPGTDRQSDLDAQINIRPLLNQIAAPALVLGMAHDRIVPVHHAKELASLIPGAAYREIDSGHLIRLENMSTLVEEVSAFIIQHETGL